MYKVILWFVLIFIGSIVGTVCADSLDLAMPSFSGERGEPILTVVFGLPPEFDPVGRAGWPLVEPEDSSSENSGGLTGLHVGDLPSTMSSEHLEVGMGLLPCPPLMR